MRSFFADGGPGAAWSRQGQLHVYVPAGDSLSSDIAHDHAVLIDTGVAAREGLALQPTEWAHATVQKLALWREDLADDQVVTLVARLREAVGGLEAFVLDAGPPIATTHACERWVSPGRDQRNDELWWALVGAVRTAAVEVFGPQCLPPSSTRRTRPHVSIGYGIASGDSGVINSTLLRARVHEPTPLPVEAVELVAVHQHPDQGCYSWDSLATAPLKPTTGI